MLEQLARVEALIEAANDTVTLSGSFAERQVRLLPPRTAREAVLNGLVHRDWHQAEPATVVWVEADSSLEVTSPGGFVGGVTAANVLTRRFARSPAPSAGGGGGRTPGAGASARRAPCRAACAGSR